MVARRTGGSARRRPRLRRRRRRRRRRHRPLQPGAYMTVTSLWSRGEILMRHTVISTPIGPERRATGRVRFGVLRGAILDARAVTKLRCFRSNSNLPKRSGGRPRGGRPPPPPPPPTAAVHRRHVALRGGRGGRDDAAPGRFVRTGASTASRRRASERARER